MASKGYRPGTMIDDSYIQRRVKTVTQDFGETVASRCGQLMKEDHLTFIQALRKALEERDMHQLEAIHDFSTERFNDRS